MPRKNILVCVLLSCIIISLAGCQGQDKHRGVVSVFPMTHYDQTLTTWLNPADSHYDTPLISTETQQTKKALLLKHYVGSSSPWNENYINHILHEPAPDDLSSLERNLINSYSNQGKPFKKTYFGENFRKYDETWLNAIRQNSHTEQFAHLHYDATHRAIAIDNLHVRALPTEDVALYSYKIAGQGYPFDNLQISSIWIGTPLYILGETHDRAWSLVVAPDFIGWVKTNGIAYTSPNFIKTWTDASFKNLIAITQTKTSLVDQGVFRASAYIGTVLPGKTTSQGYEVLLPALDLHGKAIIRHAFISAQSGTTIPLSATPRHFSFIMQSLLGRPYGWGNLYFYNDCSAELKNFFTPFGIWLPRHSSDQIYAGKWVDLSSESLKDRLSYLMKNGKPFSTLIYIDGHIILFIGNYPNPNSAQHESIPMTYQNMWGLRPDPGTRRAVIGQSVIFPLLEQFPEDTSLVSQASRRHFQLSQLDENANNTLKLELINLRELLYP